MPPNPSTHKTSRTTGMPKATPSQVLRQFRVVFNAVRTHFRDMERQIGLGGAQIWALSIIKAHPGIGITGISEQMDIHQSTASNLIKALQKRALITAAKSDEDRRSVRLELLPAGDEILARAPGPFEGVLPHALSQLDSASLQRLNGDLKTLVQLLKVDDSAASIPLADL